MQLNAPRLRLRPVQLSDAESIFQYRSHPETSKFLSMIPVSTMDVHAFIEKTSTEIDIPGTWFQFVIIENQLNKVIGDIGIHFLDNDTENKQVEIGYTLSANHRGKGYATEALHAVITFLFQNLKKHRIIASIDPTNTSSIKLIERLGFRKEAHFVESLYFHGEWVDDVIYALLAKEWK